MSLVATVGEVRRWPLVKLVDAEACTRWPLLQALRRRVQLGGADGAPLDSSAVPAGAPGKPLRLVRMVRAPRVLRP
jgi:hypothetical protein